MDSASQQQEHAAAPPPQDSYVRIGCVALIAFAAVTCFAGLNGGPAMGDHECFNAQAARQALQSGDWLIPKLYDVPHIRKTPLGTWAIVAASRLLDDATATEPVTAYSARFPSALAGFGTILVVTWLGSMLYGRRTGLVAGFVAAACAGVIVYARNAQVDMVLTLFTVLAFACFYRGAVCEPRRRRFMAAFYIAFALAMLAKAPLPLATIGLSLFVYWFVTLPLTEVGAVESGSMLVRFIAGVRRQFWRLPALWLIPGVIVFVILAGAWPVYVWARVPGALDLWRAEYLDRFSGRMTDLSKPFWYYVPIVLGLTAPYVLSIPEAVVSVVLPRYRAHRRGLAFVLTWALVGTVFLSVSSFKRPHYLLSVLPAYCLLLGPVIDRLFFGETPGASRYVRWTCIVLPVAIGVALVVAGFEIARRFAPLLPMHVLVGVLVLVVWAAACRAFARRQRVVSFGLLNLGVVVLVLLVWPALGQQYRTNAVADAVAAGLREHGVTPADEIYRVDARPDSSIQFYWGYPIRRLADELETTAFREHRGDVTEALQQEVVRRVHDALAQPHPVYLILSAENYDRWRARSDVPARVLFRVDVPEVGAADLPVVVTQARPARNTVATTQPESPMRP